MLGGDAMSRERSRAGPRFATLLRAFRREGRLNDLRERRSVSRLRRPLRGEGVLGCREIATVRRRIGRCSLDVSRRRGEGVVNSARYRSYSAP